jgi:hypothetical protein
MILRRFDLRILQDVRFWLIVSVTLHLFTITNPPLENTSQWRQADVLMIARNFYEGSHNILYPTTDIGGSLSGIVGCEFPIFNYLIYLFSIPFGFHDWFGRLINLIVSTTGVYFFYKLVKENFGGRTAFNSSIIILTSLWFTYARVSIPDTFAASLCIISLYYGVHYLKEPNIKSLLLFLVLGLVGCLSRASAAALMTVIAVPLIFGNSRWSSKLTVAAIGLIIFVCVYIWYFIWWPHLNTYGLTGHFYMGSTFSDGAALLWSQWSASLQRFYYVGFKYSGFIVFLVGLYMVFKTKNRQLLVVFLVPFIAYAIIVLKIAVGFNIDGYYMVMFIPPMALVAGYGLAQLNDKLCVLLLLVVATEGIAGQAHEFKILHWQKPWMELESIMDTVSERDDLVAITGLAGNDPVPMYMAHRRGWVKAPAHLNDPIMRDDLLKAGCKYIVINTIYAKARLSFDLPRVHESEEFIIYRLGPVSSP